MRPLFSLAPTCPQLVESAPMARLTPIQRIILVCGGAVLGLVAWGFCGLGLRELGLIDSFDPVGLTEREADPTPLVAFLEGAHWLFALCGALIAPPLAAWLLRPGGEP